MKLRCSLESIGLARYFASQANAFFPDGDVVSADDLKPAVDETLERVRACFAGIRRKYYREGEDAVFNHRMGDHYTAFLYLLGNTLHQRKAPASVCEKTFLLNKALHGLDLFYSVRLPEVFLFIHPVGTVLGNATYGNHLVVYQNVSVGATEDNRYPCFEGGTVLFSRAAVIGGVRVGPDVVFGANAFVLGAEVPANSIVVGQYPQHRVLKTDGRTVRERFFTLI